MESFGFSFANLFFNLFNFLVNILGFLNLVQQSGLNIQSHEMSFRHNLQSEFSKLGTQIIWQFSFGKAIHKNLTLRASATTFALRGWYFKLKSFLDKS